MPVQPYLDLSLLVLVALAGVNDLATRRIPNRLLAAAWLVALPLWTLAPAPGAALLAALGGAAVGLLMFLPLYLLRAMAAGDVKLMATVGVFAGPAAAFDIAVLSWCAGGLMALAIILFRGRARIAYDNLRTLLRPLLMRAAGMPAVAEPLRHASVGNMPYGLAIALGTMAWLLTRHP